MAGITPAIKNIYPKAEEPEFAAINAEPITLQVKDSMPKKLLNVKYFFIL